jgi:serine/threonine protein kinase/WD40 repeat protein
MINIGQTYNERYTIKKGLGRGGFATVHLAHDLNFERDVAIKIINLADADDSDAFYANFVTEAKISARLTHPNILDVYDYGRVGDEAYLVMPYADSSTLAQRLRQFDQMPLNTALAYFRQMVAGLIYAHRHNVIHRDIKPQNMLLMQDGRLLISDFGLAKVLAASGALTNTRVTGTPLYMAPEQWSGQAGKPTDIYALGAMLYQLLTGAPPFTGESQQQLFVQHTSAPLPRLADKRTDLPGGLQPFLEHLTAKKPAERPTAESVLTLLDGALGITTEDTHEQQRLYDELKATTALDSSELPTEALDKPLESGTPTPKLGMTPPTQKSANGVGKATMRASQAETNVVAIRRPAARPNPLGLVVIAAIGLAIIAAVVFIVLGVQNATAPQNIADKTAPDVTYPAANAPKGIGSRVFSFVPVEKNFSVNFVANDQYLEQSYLMRSIYRTVTKGAPNAALNVAQGATIWSPDGRHVVIYTEGDAFGTQPTRTPEPSPGVTPPTVRPEDRAQSGFIRLFRVEDGKEILKTGSVLRQNSLELVPSWGAFSGNGKWLALMLTGGRIGFVDLDKGTIAQSLNLESPQRIKSLFGFLPDIVNNEELTTYSYDGRYLVVRDSFQSSDPNYLAETYLYDLRALLNGGSLQNAKPITKPINVIFSPDGKKMISQERRPDSVNDQTFGLWDISGDSPKRINTLEGVFTNNGKPRDSKEYKIYRTLPGFINNDLVVAATRNPDKTVSVELDSAIITYDAKDGTKKTTIPGINNIEIIKSPPTLIVVNSPEAKPNEYPFPTDMNVYDLLTGKEKAKLPGDQKIVGVGGDQKILVTFTKSGEVRLYDLTNLPNFTALEERVNINRFSASATQISLAKNKPLMATTDEEGRVTLWRLAPEGTSR